MIYPALPKWWVRKVVLEDVNVLCVDDYGYLGMNNMKPLAIFQKHGFKVFVRWFAAPLLVWSDLIRLWPIMYRWIEEKRASDTVRERMDKFMGRAHCDSSIPLPNDKVSAPARKESL